MSSSLPPTAFAKPVACLTGPSATGKTGLALELARDVPGLEIVNADSMLVYRGMDIGTAKPTAEERAQCPHHLIDVREPNESFTAGDFVRLTEEAVAAIHARGGRALLVGGTGFYLKALIYGLWDAPVSEPSLRAELEKRENLDLYRELEQKDDETAWRIGQNDRYRLIRALETFILSGKKPSELKQEAAARSPRENLLTFVLDRSNDELYARIAERTRAMLGQGLVEEVRRLRDTFGQDIRPLEAVGYAETCRYLTGTPPEGREVRPGLAGLEDEINLGTRQLIKRQRTLFRGLFKATTTEDAPAPQAAKESLFFLLDQDQNLLKQKLRDLYI